MSNPMHYTTAQRAMLADLAEIAPGRWVELDHNTATMMSLIRRGRVRKSRREGKTVVQLSHNP